MSGRYVVEKTVSVRPIIEPYMVKDLESETLTDSGFGKYYESVNCLTQDDARFVAEALEERDKRIAAKDAEIERLKRFLGIDGFDTTDILEHKEEVDFDVKWTRKCPHCGEPVPCIKVEDTAALRAAEERVRELEKERDFLRNIK